MTGSLTGGLERINAQMSLFFVVKQNPFGHLWTLRFAVHLKFLSKHQSKTEMNIHFLMWWNRNFRTFMGLIVISQQALQSLAFLCLLCWK